MKLIVMLLVMALNLLTACTATHSTPTVDPSNLHQLQNMSVSNTPTVGPLGSDVSQIRLKALQDTAMSLGAQGGLAWNSRLINFHLENTPI